MDMVRFLSNQDYFLTEETLLPLPTRDFSAFLAASFEGLISDFVTGVFGDTLFDGLQYGVLPLVSFVPLPSPHGFPFLVSTHFSFSHRFNAAPFSVFFTFPDFFLHFAIACDALAEGKTSYCAFTFL